MKEERDAEASLRCPVSAVQSIFFFIDSKVS